VRRINYWYFIILDLVRANAALS